MNSATIEALLLSLFKDLALSGLHCAHTQARKPHTTWKPTITHSSEASRLVETAYVEQILYMTVADSYGKGSTHKLSTKG